MVTGLDPGARGARAAWVVILAGVSAGLHIGKLPPAIPVLQDQLGISLVQAGFLLSLVQLAGMTVGALIGLAADAIGLRRSMLIGLAVLSLAGFAGGMAQGVDMLLALRAVEGFGFLLTIVPAPGLIARCVRPARRVRMLGIWGAFMPFAMALALLTGPGVMAVLGWPGWWWLIAAASALAGLALAAAVAPDAPALVDVHAGGAAGWRQRLGTTLGSTGPWLAALTFAVYSAQWLVVIGFLPALYEESGWSGALGAILTALVAAVNIVGNVAAGQLLSRGAQASRVLCLAFAAMALGVFLAFGGPAAQMPVLQYAGAIAFSMFGGLIPGGLFGLAPRLAPGERTVSTTVGWMMQWSAIGQFCAPPLVGWIAGQAGHWHWTWVVLGACSAAGAVLSWGIGRRLARAPRTA